MMVADNMYILSFISAANIEKKHIFVKYVPDGQILTTDFIYEIFRKNVDNRWRGGIDVWH